MEVVAVRREFPMYCQAPMMWAGGLAWAVLAYMLVFF